jgi:alginate O-acetyltransferase complex protein AlgI
MSVTSWQFFALLAATTVLLGLAPTAARKSVLLGASLLFYLNAGIASTVIIGALIAVNFWFMLGTLRAPSEAGRDRIYLASMLFNIAVFCTLKYCFEPAPNVAATSWHVLGLSVGYPLGLSFIILMLHSAVTDAHSGKLVPDGKFSTFLLFGTFFPYVSAGPVERLHRMQGPLSLPTRPTLGDVREGAELIALGLIKKLVTANRLKPYVDSVFSGDLPNSSATVIFAIILNAAYVYCDFSGYTDIARGAARCLGIEVQINFDRPFGARSVTDFWRRWHISFSNWLRDYLYMPIAFTLRRFRLIGTSLSLLITFALCGYWHRAAWTFLLFGMLHGVAMVIELKFAAGPASVASRSFGMLRRFAAHFYTLIFLAATIVLFSSRDLSQAGQIFERALTGPYRPSATEFAAYKGAAMFGMMLIGIVVWQGFDAWYRRLTPRYAPLFFLIAAWVILFFGKLEGEGFVYAQF